ncbi:MAG: hydrolase [Marmoricola sp.]|nr:hydrolase [Marmoricola sp.]
MTDDWRTDLARAVARAVEQGGPDAVIAALGERLDELATHPDVRPEPFRPGVSVLAIVACEAGRLGVLIEPDGRLSVHVARTHDALVDQVGETTDPHVVVTADRSDSATTTAERRALLAHSGLVAPGWYSGSGFTEDELLDACTAILIAID